MLCRPPENVNEISARAKNGFSWQNRAEWFCLAAARRNLSMSYLHLFFGIVVFIVFLVTGKFMRVDFPDKEIIPQEFRLLMRSRHIYILLSGLLHILLGLYLQIQPQVWRKSVQIFGSLLLFAGTVTLVWAFVYETYTTKTFSEASRSGLYTTLAGTIFHLLGGFRIKSKRNE